MSSWGTYFVVILQLVQKTRTLFSVRAVARCMKYFFFPLPNRLNSTVELSNQSMDDFFLNNSKAITVVLVIPKTTIQQLQKIAK